MKIKRSMSVLFAAILCFGLMGCHPKEKQKEKESLTIAIKTTPIGLGSVPGIGDVEIYDLFIAASEKFKAQYDQYNVTFEISRYNYPDEKEQLADKHGSDEAADIFYAGSYNIATYAANGWLVSLDDIIDEKLRADIDETIWEQNSIEGKVYTMPFQQLQNTLLVNKTMMEEAGLHEYLPEKDTIAQWSTEEFNMILRKLKDALSEQNKFAMTMYAANNQGDSHIMTLLRAYGGSLYDETGRFAVNTPEGIRALEWIQNMDAQGITPKGAENLELLDCVNLFYNGQIAICIGNLTNLWDAWNKGLDVFAANFPSLDGAGYCTSSTNGFCVFDNGDPDKIQVCKDFIRFIYMDEELMQYTLGTLPVSHSVTEKHRNEIRMLKAYDDNTKNAVDNIRNHLGWQEVRDVFYPNIRDLLMKKETPGETAAAIDRSCNAALEQGRAAVGK